MAFRAVTMLEVNEIIRLWLGGVPRKRIVAKLGLNVKTVRRYRAAARTCGLGQELKPEALDFGSCCCTEKLAASSSLGSILR